MDSRSRRMVPSCDHCAAFARSAGRALRKARASAGSPMALALRRSSASRRVCSRASIASPWPAATASRICPASAPTRLSACAGSGTLPVVSQAAQTRGAPLQAGHLPEPSQRAQGTRRLPAPLPARSDPPRVRLSPPPRLWVAVARRMVKPLPLQSAHRSVPRQVAQRSSPRQSGQRVWAPEKSSARRSAADSVSARTRARPRRKSALSPSAAALRVTSASKKGVRAGSSSWPTAWRTAWRSTAESGLAWRRPRAS